MAAAVAPQPDGHRRGHGHGRRRRNVPREQGIIYNWDSCVCPVTLL